MRAVVAGASGLVGSSLLRKLLENHSISEVLALVRKPLEKEHPKLRQVLVEDFSTLPERAGELVGEVYFCALGTTIKKAGTQENFRKVDLEAVMAFGQLALRNHAEVLVVVSAKGANSSSAIFYNRTKGEAEDGLRRLFLPRLLVLRPGLLLGERKEKRPAEHLAIKATHFMPGFLSRHFATDVEALSERMVREALRPGPPVEIIEAESI